MTEGKAPTIAELLQHRTADTYFKQAAQSIKTLNADYTVDRNGLIVRLVPFNGTTQILVTQTLQDGLPYLSRHPVMKDQRGQRQKYDSI